MPTQVTPALIHAVRFSSVGSTAPVTINIVQGIGPVMFLTKEGPPTFRRENLTQITTNFLGESNFRNGTTTRCIGYEPAVTNLGDFRIEKWAKNKIGTKLQK